jgi:hypothetical protein
MVAAEFPLAAITDPACAGMTDLGCIDIQRSLLLPSPAFRGRGGARREAVGGERLYTGLSKTLTSQAFGLGPSSPAKSGRGSCAAPARLNVDTA